MKKYTLALALVAVLPVVSAGAYEYGQPQSEHHSSRYVGKNNAYKKAVKRKAGGYKNIINNNFYYGQPAQYYTQKVDDGNTNNTSREFSDYYRGGVKDTNTYAYEKRQADDKKQPEREVKTYSSQERKFFLAHPFFQPLKGHVGSVTDVSYARNNFDFDLINGSTLGLDPNVPSEYGQIIIPNGEVGLNGKAETSMFAVKEDLSYGITDRLSLVLMAQYDKTKVTFKDWSSGEPADTTSNSGFNLFGGGFQGRFVDTDNWIVMADAFFQHQKDTTNTFMGGLKAGYKIGRTTIYGLGRASYINLIHGDIYGAYVGNSSGDWLMLSYKTNVKNVFQAEGGIGMFAALNKYFTLNGEAIYGYYDWHNQFNVKGALGIQPADHFALNLYASMVLYDSAKGKTRQYINYDVDPDLPTPLTSSKVYSFGDYDIKKYNEWKIGVQGILYF